ncbi:hypothetical protein GRI68_09560 [Altererythrobacter halimionae]|uniref:Magnesium transporter MgtE intracellular domain-containing protein n=1 Tax=Alteriqipengyuania halimionae TaxID=1926630 RepID=A0A6I4U7K0_9SPHN|nr:hypothetical protein [Alteriqipengyuania halimionae]
MLKRPPLLVLMAGAAALSAVAHGVNAAGPQQEEAPAKAPPTRLGSAIQSEINENDKTTRERKRALDLREQALKASEKRLKNNLENQQGDAKPEKAGAGARNGEGTDEETEEARTYDQLARIYQAMKPKKAAVVFEQLDLDVQIAVARRMRERSIAQILAAMTPAAAARVSMALAGKRPAPRRGKSQPAN